MPLSATLALIASTLFILAGLACAIRNARHNPTRRLAEGDPFARPFGDVVRVEGVSHNPEYRS